ncbi:hypothetical protein E2562_023350 [Oryza meyeriana var. granulata]|uniref:Uncharacterized protein n=1 Tax=Oryza meyeriana var. granulata TaxID=110450 RepID=A0A6G1E0F1_9ORYZ|nr:hypothetical protein E2562_023350 [Oryza meyeriana var. granulata]
MRVHGWDPTDDANEYYGLEATMDVYGFNLEDGQQTDGNEHPIDGDLEYIEDCFRVTPIEDGRFFYGGPGNYWKEMDSLDASKLSSLSSMT